MQRYPPSGDGRLVAQLVRTMREPRHDTPRVPADRLPPFWILAKDSHGRPIDSRVVGVAERLWPWAYRHVVRELHDAASAAQLVEAVALEVSGRLQDEPSVGQNLAGYFITAFHRRVRQQLLKENRLTYEGLLQELELNHHLAAPDWEAAMEQELCFKVLVDQLPHHARHMLHYRVLGFSWNEIGRVLHISGKQARSRFYYELNKVHAKLLGKRTEGAEHSEGSN